MRHAIDKHAMRRTIVPIEHSELTVKALGDGEPGVLEGYASIYNVIDDQGEIVRPGTFKKSSEERVPAGKVKLMSKHAGYNTDITDVIGTLTYAKDRRKGLFIKAEFSEHEKAKTAYMLAKEGHVTGLSVGFLSLDWGFVTENEEQILEHKEGKLMEVTLTAFPANEPAQVTAIKSEFSGFSSALDGVAEAVAEEQDPKARADKARHLLSGILGKTYDLEGIAKTLTEMLEIIKATSDAPVARGSDNAQSVTVCNNTTLNELRAKYALLTMDIE